MLNKLLFAALMLLSLNAALVSAAPAELPKTGQVTSYGTGTIDDGALQRGIAWPDPRFTVASSATGTGSGMVTDKLTGLVWLQDANCILTNYTGFDTDQTSGDGWVTWQHALDFVAGINNGTYPNCGAGHTDWRLPNVNELESLVHAEFTKETTCGGSCGTNTAWLNTKGFSNVQAYHYWSSTSYVGSGFAWYVTMIDGMVSAGDKLYGRSVWPVRSGL
jgi:hypothetical protein